MRFKDYLVAGVLGVASLLSPKLIHADEPSRPENPQDLEKIVEDYSAGYEEIKSPNSSDPNVHIKSLKYSGVSRGITRLWAEVVEGYVSQDMRIEDFPYKSGRKQEFHVTRSKWDKAPEIQEPEFLKKVNKLDYVVYTKADGTKEESLEVNVPDEGLTFLYIPEFSLANPEGSTKEEKHKEIYGRVKREEATELYEYSGKELSRFSKLLELDKYIERTKARVKSVEPLLATLAKQEFNPQNYQMRGGFSEGLELKPIENLSPISPSIVLDTVEPQTFVPRYSWYGSFMLHTQYRINQKDGKKGILTVDLNDIDADGKLDMVVFDDGKGLDFTLNPNGEIRIDGPFDETYSQEDGKRVLSRGQEIYGGLLRDPGIRKNLLDARDRLNKEVEKNLPPIFEPSK